MHIRRRVNHLVCKYKTRDPFDLAAYCNIEVVYTPLSPSIRGFYDRILRRKFIVLNNLMDYHIQKG